MPTSVIQRSFAGGELAPALHARADQEKYTYGLKTCRNFIVRREGGASNRAGFRYIATAGTATADHQLIRFVPTSATGTAIRGVLIEIGVAYLRFFYNGAPVMAVAAAYSGVTTYNPGDVVISAGVNYYCIATTVGNAPPNVAFWYAMPASGILEVPTPYSAAMLPLGWVQNGNIITLTHPSTDPRELVFTSLSTWVLRTISTAPSTSTPTGGAGVAAGVGTRTFRYRVTAAAAETYEESLPSSVITVAATIEPTPVAPIALSWNVVAGAAEYYVYCDPYGNGVYGYIGTAMTNAFNDVNFVPDFNVTPPIARVLFGTSNTFPTCAAYYQQRRFFANTNVEPDSIWGSRIGFFSNFGISSPLQDDDAITFRIAGNQHNPVRHMIAAKSGLIVMTDAGEWTVTGAGGPKQPITPNSIDAEQETYVGASATVPPVIIGNTVIYPQARGSVMRELKFSQEVEGLAGRDLTLFATHLFEGKTVMSMDYQQVPDSLVWVVLNDRSLVGLTYIPEQEVWGWHRHDTGASGGFEAVCVVPEDSEDALYAIVKRTIGASTVRYIERLESRVITTFDTDAFFVDSGLSYSGAPAVTFAGLTHLNGQLVAVVGDGEVVFDGNAATASAAEIAQFTVAGGLITLSAAYSNVHVGLPFTAQLKTLALDVQGSEIRDQKKRIANVALLIERSSRVFEAGPDENNLRAYDQDTFEEVTDQFTGIVELPLTSEFDQTGSVLIQQSQPLPITVLGVIPNVETGG